MAFLSSAAHIIQDNKIYQVLDASGEQWNEAKTAQSIADGKPVAEIVDGKVVPV